MNLPDVATMRLCKKCGQRRPADTFPVLGPKSPGKRTSECLECKRARKRDYLAKHPPPARTELSKHRAVWYDMLRRCYQPACDEFRNYGARGIRVCDRWLFSFDNFIADMGLRPSVRHTLDRTSNDGNYEPGNCRWATMLVQANNTRFNRFVEYNGERLTVSQWAARLGFNRHFVQSRLDRGWSVEAAMTQPPSRGIRGPGRLVKIGSGT